MGAFDTVIPYDKATYIGKSANPSIVVVKLINNGKTETDTGNKVSRRAVITGATNIILGGKSIIQTGAILRGDLRRAATGQHVAISMGRYCVIGQGSIIRPPGKIYKGTFTFYPVRIADFVNIESDCIIEAASIGHGVEIGHGSIIGKFVAIHNLAVIRPNTVLPEGTVVPSMTVWAGNPGRLVDTLPETYQETVEAERKSYYQRFRPG